MFSTSVTAPQWMVIAGTIVEKARNSAGNGRAVVVASDIFGIHTGRHKEICDSIAEEVTHGWCEGRGLYSQHQCTINEMEHISAHRHAIIMYIDSYRKI